MTLRPILSLTLALSLGAASLPASVHAAPGVTPADEEAARGHFKEGVSLFKDEDYRSALFEFEAAYKLSKNPQLLYNIAVSHEELHQYAAAIVAYRQYVELMGDELDKERLKRVERELEKLQRRVGTVVVTSDPPGATVRDGKRILGVTPFEAPLDLGEIALDFEAQGYETQQETVSVAGGERIPVTVTLRKQKNLDVRLPSLASTDEVAGDDDRRSPQRVERLRQASLTTLAIAGATGVGAIVVGSLAVGADRDLADERERATTRSELDALERRRDGLSLTADVLIGVTAAFAVTSLALGVAHLRAKKRRDETAHVQPTLGGVRVTF